MRAPLGWGGTALALLYVTVAAATAQLSSRPVLPLFDGFAPPTPYAWVNPPPGRAGENVAPGAADRDVPLDAEGSPASNVSTEDAQAIVGLDKGSVRPHPPDTTVKVRVLPADPGTLAPLPAGLRPVSNAYHVLLSYLPSETPVTELVVKGTIALTAAEAGGRMLHSSDGEAWEELAFRPYGQDHGLFTELHGPGWFVVVASSTSAPSNGTDGSAVPRGVLLALAAVIPIVGAVLVVRLPSPVPEDARRTGPPAGARGRPTGKKRPKRHQ